MQRWTKPFNDDVIHSARQVHFHFGSACTRLIASVCTCLTVHRRGQSIYPPFIECVDGDMADWTEFLFEHQGCFTFAGTYSFLSLSTVLGPALRTLNMKLILSWPLSNSREKDVLWCEWDTNDAVRIYYEKFQIRKCCRKMWLMIVTDSSTMLVRLHRC